MASPVKPGASRLSLVAALAVALLAELCLNRVAARLLHHDLMAPAGRLRTCVDLAGLFSFYASAALAVMVATLGLVRFLVAPTTVPRGARGAMSALAVAFVPLAVLGVVLRLPPVLSFYLGATFTALSLLVALAGLLTTAQGRIKLGLGLLVMPIALHFAIEIASQRVGRTGGATQTLLAFGEASVVMTAVLGVFCLAPRKPKLVVGLGAGALATVLALVLTRLDWDIAMRIAAYGFGVELPLSTTGVLAYSFAFGCWSSLVVMLVAERGGARLRGWGILLIGLSGYQLEQAGQVAATLVGLMCVLSSMERVEMGLAATEAWRTVVQKVAAALGAASVTTVGEPGNEEARMRLLRDGETVEVTLGQREGRFALVEAVCGLAPPGEAAPLSLTRRGTERLGKAEGLLVETGDVIFDELFRVRDARELHGPDAVLGDELRPRLCDSVEGWLGVWPARGVRYRARTPRLVEELNRGEATATSRVVGLVDLLVQLKRS